MWAGATTRVINGLHSFSAKVCNTVDTPLVSNSSPMSTSFHSLITISCNLDRGATTRVHTPFSYGCTGRGRSECDNRQRRYTKPFFSYHHTGVAINRSATGVWPGGGEGRIPGLPPDGPTAWPSAGAGLAGGATVAGSEPNGMRARVERGGVCPQIHQVQILL